MKRIAPLLLLLALACTACGKQAVPEDFSFAMTWNCYGISSYDSATGELVKTRDERISTEYRLTEAERQQVWEWICELKPETYPDRYDPNPEVGCDPPEHLILTVRTADGEKTITAMDVAGAEDSGDPQGRKFLTVCRAIQHMLTETQAWQAMPDGELFYD